MNNSISNKKLPLKILIIIILFIALCATKIPAQERYFYTNKPYGSEALFNPITLIINGGYDICQLQNVPNKITEPQYGRMLKTVLQNLGDPFPRIKAYGWSKFMRTEFLPISFTVETMQWVPNYQQHLIGGGMLYTKMKEWYEDHGYPCPWLLSSVTLMTQHLYNEVMETGPHEGYSVDEISDIYIFDLGGIVLFSFDSINEFFSKELNLSDWSLQASVSLPTGRINAGQYFAIKWKLPFWEDYSLFYRYGMGALYGLSRKMDSTDNFSVGLGFKTKHLVDIDPKFRERTIETSWYAGMFYDRNNSLLASLVMSGLREQFIMADVYPGIIKFGNFSPGIWTVIGRNGRTTFGISTRYVFTLGAEINY